MASTSASSIQKSFKYDVFLSFRGEDTRKNFVDHLYHALKQNGIYTYKDDEEISKGKAISDELIRSIEDSRIYIIVFSKNYASSSWCLNELVKIMECQKTNGQIAYPIFYDVEPTEVRNQSGVVGEAFAKHVNEEAAGRWRDALKKAASLAGRELKNTFDGHEAKFIQKVVEEILKELPSINCSLNGGKLVGMEKRVEVVVSSLGIDIDDFRMIGIKGMGGAGKTTLARAVFDQISSKFEVSSFIDKVRERSKDLACGLESLQKQVLSAVGSKVLFVLDDVDGIDQLEALADLSWFKPGSRVIITTRDDQVLRLHGLPSNMILGVNLLSYEEAYCLFNKYAFRSEIPNPSFEVLSRQGVSYAAGLPLTIKVLGSSLYGKDELVWKDTLHRLKTKPLGGTLEILELSYCGLEEDRKEMFLDVACILKGWEKEKAIRALESCGHHAISGLSVLEQKSLITLSSHGYLDMHDSIVEMGKSIVRRSHPDMPYKHSRLWIKEEIEDILVEDKGTKATRCIKLRTVDQDIVMKGLQKMKELRYLEGNGSGKYYHNRSFNHDNIDDVDSLHLPNSLRYLYWHDYPFTCLPKTFSAKNLVGLEMRYSKIDQLWKDGEKKEPTKLRFIDLSVCEYLITWDFGLTKNLETLRLYNCLKLAELHVPIESCKLKCLEIIFCPLIRTLDLKLAHNLDTLTVEHCWGLVEVHMPNKISCKLQYLRIVDCDLIQTLDLERAQNLDTLTVEDCRALVEVHMPIESRKLQYLRIVDCDLIQTLDLERAHNLDTLTVTSCRAMVELRLPTELKHPIVDNCSMLKNIYRIPNSDTKTLNLVSEVENPKPKSINLYCSNLRTLDLGWWGVLDKLNIDKHETLVQLQLSFVKIRELSLRRCSKLKTITLTETINLKKLYIEECRDLVEVDISKYEGLQIRNLKIIEIEIHSSKLSTLNLTQTWHLEELKLFQCEDLVEIHMPVGCLELKIVEIHSSKLRTLNLTQARNLEKLHLIQCEDLLELHMPIKSPKLKTIIIRCSKMRTLYLGLSPCLEHLDLSDCCNLVEIHAPVGCLSGSFMFKPCLVNQGLPMDSSIAELRLTARSLGICPSHLGINSPKFHFECIYNGIPLSFTEQLVKLISLNQCDCLRLASFSEIICGLQLTKLTIEGSIPEAPKELDQLESLEELSFLSTKIEHVPDNLFRLQHLKVLRFKSCWSLKKLPEDIGRLECLEELHVTDCTFLRDIPNSICEMKRLKSFHLTDCILVERLPKGIGSLKRTLKVLSTKGTGIRDFPPSIDQLELDFLEVA